MNAPLISDATLGKITRALLATPSTQHWDGTMTVLWLLHQEKYAGALEHAREASHDADAIADVISALDEANEEAAREHDRREAFEQRIEEVAANPPKLADMPPEARAGLVRSSDEEDDRDWISRAADQLNADFDAGPGGIEGARQALARTRATIDARLATSPPLPDMRLDAKTRITSIRVDPVREAHADVVIGFPMRVTVRQAQTMREWCEQLQTVRVTIEGA